MSSLKAPLLGTRVMGSAQRARHLRQDVVENCILVDTGTEATEEAGAIDDTGSIEGPNIVKGTGQIRVENGSTAQMGQGVVALGSSEYHFGSRLL